MDLVLFGPPGSGKGTQAQRVAARLGVPQISTGDMLRDAADRATALGAKARDVMAAGELVPDEVILGIISDRLSRADATRGAVYDGFPRTVAQARGLDSLLAAKDRKVGAVVALRVDDTELVRRMLGRGRADDAEAVVRNRLRVYAERTAPVAEFYRARGLYAEVDGTGAIEEITERVIAAVKDVR